MGGKRSSGTSSKATCASHQLASTDVRCIQPLQNHNNMIARQLSSSASDILDADLNELRCYTDRLFGALMVMQWLAGIVVVLTISPRTWQGAASQTHPHLWAALALGGLITSLPVLLAWFRPGEASTRYVIAAAQVLWSSLLIHLMGGRIETHFHIFGSLALLAFYRDWKVLVMASAIVALDHIVRGVLWPYSVYGVTSSQEWRWLEHTAWVVFEDVFLLIGNHISMKHLKQSAMQKAQLQQSRQLIEDEVEKRTSELQIANAELKNHADDAEIREREMARLVEESARLADEYAAAKAAAEAAAEAKSQFLANMSHEIRTPMTAILGFTDVLLEEEGLENAPPERVASLTTIRRNAEHLLCVINDILDLSKIDAGKFQIEHIDCSPHEILLDVKELMQVRADSKGLNWQVELDGPLPTKIHSDPTRLRQILINLAGNAIKFTEVGSVTLVARMMKSELGNRLIFDMVDTGIGMTDEQCQKMFQPFQQADSSMSRKFGGTGLGLAISKRFAELLGGDINVRSEPDRGSTFTLVIDIGSLQNVELSSRLEKPQPTIAAGAAQKTPDQVLKNVRILLIEDGPDNQRLINFLLKKAGASVEIAENGLIGRDLVLEAVAAGQPYDVILMDMQMPVMDGYTATRELRERNYDGPIVALTAHALSEDLQKCLDAGCDEFATKPVNRTQLIETVRSFVKPVECV